MEETLTNLQKKKLKELIESEEVLLFMKGDKYLPECGFSAKVVEILNELKVEYTTFDILQDEEVRHSLKLYSNWPTYPQLYHKGELIGGCDIITEMFIEGELQELFKPKYD